MGTTQKIFMCIYFTMGFEIDFYGNIIDSSHYFLICQLVTYFYVFLW